MHTPFPAPEMYHRLEVLAALRQTLERFVPLQSREPAERAFLEYLALLRNPNVRQAMERHDQ